MNKPVSCQIQHELKSWLRIIEFLRQENALLKYRLSELIDNSDDRNFLKVAEHFQNEFLLKDEALKRLMKEVRDYSEVVEKQETASSSHLLNTHTEMRKKIHQLEENYNILSLEFNKRMLQRK